MAYLNEPLLLEDCNLKVIIRGLICIVFEGRKGLVAGQGKDTPDGEDEFQLKLGAVFWPCYLNYWDTFAVDTGP